MPDVGPQFTAALFIHGVSSFGAVFVSKSFLPWCLIYCLSHPDCEALFFKSDCVFLSFIYSGPFYIF